MADGLVSLKKKRAKTFQFSFVSVHISMLGTVGNNHEKKNDHVALICYAGRVVRKAYAFYGD
jgi:hypothetical protein